MEASQLARSCWSSNNNLLFYLLTLARSSKIRPMGGAAQPCTTLRIASGNNLTQTLLQGPTNFRVLYKKKAAFPTFISRFFSPGRAYIPEQKLAFNLPFIYLTCCLQYYCLCVSSINLGLGMGILKGAQSVQIFFLHSFLLFCQTCLPPQEPSPNVKSNRIFRPCPTLF